MSSPTQIFIAYSRKDSELMEKLRTHLRPLERAKMAKIWYDGIIEAGNDWEKEIKNHLHSADIILLLISADFIDSDYCYDDEMMDALKKHEQNDAKVIPIILRPCAWKYSPFAKLQVLPKDGKPVIELEDYAFTEIAEVVAKICQNKKEENKSGEGGLLLKGKIPSKLKPIDEYFKNNNPSSDTFKGKDEDDIPYFETKEAKETQAIADSILSGNLGTKNLSGFKPNPNFGNSFFDSRDGQTYRTIKMPNGKTWFAENLKFNVGEGAYLFNNDPSMEEKYGRLYTWEASHKACPKGWRLPTFGDWQNLVDFHTPQDGSHVLGFNDIACKSLMQSGTKNFAAKLGGYRDDKGNFYQINEFGLYWALDSLSDETNSCWIFSPKSDLGTYGDGEKKTFALSIRCIKDY